MLNRKDKARKSCEFAQAIIQKSYSRLPSSKMSQEIFSVQNNLQKLKRLIKFLYLNTKNTKRRKRNILIYSTGFPITNSRSDH
jgi:hypothetical protein